MLMAIDTWALSQDELETMEERAGIYELCAGMTRAEAERLALEDMYQRERDDDTE